MPEALEYNPVESRERHDKVGLFRVVDGKVVQFPLGSKRTKPEMPVQLPVVEKWDASGPHDPEGEVQVLDPVTPEKIETKELADAVNDLMAESEKPLEDKPAVSEAIPLIDKMLRATTLEEFNALCEREESVEIEGKAFSGAELKQIVSEAKDAYDKNKILSTAKALNRIPQGPLLEKLEQLIDSKELLGLMKEVETAYKQ